MDGNFADDLKLDLPARECNSTILFNNIELENDWLRCENTSYSIYRLLMEGIK